ncbi:MAG: GMC family oxidoreductase N-terminal domain-containing protein [Acidobacteriia bacterium]|nr:GMC family oxidoreductase N-terminal domain-containing protein [Terriglobia bacterium]
MAESARTNGHAEDLFDYIIVGAGSAGCVLANRLSADPSIRVCLIEAGPHDSNPFIKVPLGVVHLLDHPKVNWRFTSVPQKQAGGRVLPIPLGKTLGGTSSINGMVYTRGHPHDYDDWAAAGCPGWSFREVLPYFTRSENNENFPESAYHGKGGPTNVTNLDSYNPLCEALFQAAESLGMKRCPDFCGPTHEGFTIRQSTVRGGMRESTARSYLKPARGRNNLTVLTKAQVTRVVFEGRRAVGVEFVRENTVQRVRARREIVVSAGTYGSSKLLMLSGVGDGEELKRYGIPVVLSAPGVGRNLQEHVVAPIRYDSPTTVPYGLSLRTVPRVAWSFVEYLLFRRGLLANSIMHAGGFVKSDPGLDRPDVQLMLLPAYKNEKEKGRLRERLGFSHVAIGHGYGLTAMVMRPKSRGQVNLASNDYRVMPLIDPNFFADERDLDLLVYGLKLARRVLEAPAFNPYRGTELVPGPDVQGDAALKDYARNFAVTGVHPVGTCRMGSDANAVTDAELRVKGIEGLRVVDGSIMPTLIGGNTNGPIIMIAEKAADMILGKPPLPAETRI